MTKAVQKHSTYIALQNTFKLLKQKSYWSIWKIFGFSLLSGIMDLTGLAVILLYLRIALSGIPSFLEPYIGGYSQEQITIYGGIATACFIIFKNILSTHSNHLLNKFIFAESQKTTLQAYKYAMNLPYTDFMNNTHSDLAASIGGEIRRAYLAAAQPMIMMVRDVVIMFMLFSVVMFINPIITSILFILASFFLIINIRFIRKHAMNLATQTEKSITNTRKWLSYSLQSYVDIKLSGQNRFVQNYDEAISNDVECQLKTKDADAIPLAQNEIILTLSIIIIASYLSFNNEDITNLFPTLIILAFAGLRMLSLMGRIFMALKSIAISNNLVQKVIKLKESIEQAESQERQKETEDAWNNEEYIDFKRSINVKNLHYSYVHEADNCRRNFMLNNISLSIPKGSFVGFIGKSGGGKTTLINLIIGLISPDKGEISWDDNKMNTSQQKVNFWKHVGYIPQNPVVLPISIRENITANMPRNHKINDEKIWESLKLAQLDDFVFSLENGLDTILQGENASLSGGQKQRLVLARLFYNTPDIIILDEATSALDNQTEYAVTQALKELHKKGCTILCVAHRLSTIKNTEILFLLDEGDLVAQGTFSKLMNVPLFKNLIKCAET